MGLSQAVVDADIISTPTSDRAWECIWFGRYPQTLVTNAQTIQSLDQALGWNMNGDISYKGETYRRVSQGMATGATPIDASFHWSKASPMGYVYLKWEPIKWRILESDEATAVVISDVALDDRRYNRTDMPVTWEESTIHSWLNGYPSSMNTSGEEWAGRGFLHLAFNDDEYSAIQESEISNPDNPDGTGGGKDTRDKVFLLSFQDVRRFNSGDASVPGNAADLRSLSSSLARSCRPSDYAHVMGASTWTDGYCDWWLRSPGQGSDSAIYVGADGSIQFQGGYVNYVTIAVRPVMRILLSNYTIKPAGTVRTDG